MRKDSVIHLIQITADQDDLGNPLPEEEVARRVFAEKASVRLSEFYQAAATSLRPELMFIVWTGEYAGESVLEYMSKRYKIIRTYEPNPKETELTCERL